MQAFKPIAARHLLEIPLIIMDTALFYRSYLNLTAEAAKTTVMSLVDDAERYGGLLTINWHDRSLAPERLWEGVYTDFVDELRRNKAWFPTVAQAASWFRQRRSAVFDRVSSGGDSVHVKVSAESHPDLPPLRVRVHTPWSDGDGAFAGHGPAQFTDVPFTNTLDARVHLRRRQFGHSRACADRPVTAHTGARHTRSYDDE